MYLMTTKALMIFFLFTFIVQIPVIGMYMSGQPADHTILATQTDVKRDTTSSALSVLGIFSLGNIGKLQAACQLVTINETKANMECSHGTMGNLTDYGLAEGKAWCEFDGSKLKMDDDCNRTTTFTKAGIDYLQ